MARRKQTAGGWIVAILAAIALVPKDVWIGLGILATVVAVMWLAVKWQASRPKRPQQQVKAPGKPEPTLAELIATTGSHAAQHQSSSRPIGPAQELEKTDLRVSTAPSGAELSHQAPQPSKGMQVPPAELAANTPRASQPGHIDRPKNDAAHPYRGNLEEAKAAVSLRNATGSAARALTSVVSGCPSTPQPPPVTADVAERTRPRKSDCGQTRRDRTAGSNAYRRRGLPCHFSCRSCPHGCIGTRPLNAGQHGDR